MEKATVVEIGQNDSIVITKNGKVVGFVEVKPNRYDERVEMVANPVTSYDFYRDREQNVFNSFATTGATNFKDAEDISSAENFIKAIKREANK
jgi:hypothetical protein